MKKSTHTRLYWIPHDQTDVYGWCLAAHGDPIPFALGSVTPFGRFWRWTAFAPLYCPNYTHPTEYLNPLDARFELLAEIGTALRSGRLRIST